MSISITSLLSSLWLPVVRGEHAKRFTAALQSVLVLFLSMALGACGGGGSSDNAPAAQPFTFAQAGPITAHRGETITNIASGPGADGVSYVSTDGSIARVDGATGAVTLVGDGSVVIVANKLVNIPNNTVQMVAGQASYTINSSPQPLTFEQPGPINNLYVHDTITNKASGASLGVVHYSSDNTNVATVDSASGLVTLTGPGTAVIKADKIADLSYTDQKLITSSATYTINAKPSGPGFSARYSHTVTAFNNQLWIIGGADQDNNLKNDVWSSPDGINWTEQTANAPFAPRGLHQVVAFNNQLWVIGGFGGYDGDNALLNDVWSSPDGINWTLQTAAANFTPRGGHQVVVFNNQMLLTAGYNSTVETNEVWSSSDGINWTQLTTATPMFSTRHAHQMVVYNSKVWVIGGYDNGFADAPLNDVWSSTDGVTWNQEAAAAEFPARGNHQVVAYNNELWLIGGYDGSGSTTNYNDVWSSSDGVTWTEKTAAAAFWPRNSHQVVAYNNQLLLLGGIATDPNDLTQYIVQGDEWSSSDGIDWQVLYNGAFQAP